MHCVCVAPPLLPGRRCQAAGTKPQGSFSLLRMPSPSVAAATASAMVAVVFRAPESTWLCTAR